MAVRSICLRRQLRISISSTAAQVIAPPSLTCSLFSFLGLHAATTRHLLRMLNSSLRRVARQCPSSPLPSRPSTPTQITASFSSHTHQRRHSSSKRPVPPTNNHSAIPATQVKTVGTKNKTEVQAKELPEAPTTKETETSGTIDVTKKRPGVESRLASRKETRGKKDYSNEWLLNVPSVAPTNHLKREGMYSGDLSGAVLTPPFRRPRSIILLNTSAYRH